MRRGAGQRFAHFADFFLQRAAVPGQRRPRGLLAPGRDDLHHGLGLREAELAVQKRAPGELARPGGGGAGPQHRPQQAAGHVQPPVAGKLHHVLARKAGRRAEIQRDDLVDQGAVRVVRVAEQRAVPPDVVERLSVRRNEHPARDLPRARAGNPHHADGRRRLRGRNRRDGVARRVVCKPFHGEFLRAKKGNPNTESPLDLIQSFFAPSTRP